MKADQRRLFGRGRSGEGSISEALGGGLGRALAIDGVRGGCEGCAWRQRIRSYKLRVLELDES